MPHLHGPTDLKRESRPAGTERLPECLLGGDTGVDSAKALQVQTLCGRYGVPDNLAALLAPLVWEGRRND